MPWWGWALTAWGAVGVPLALLIGAALRAAMPRDNPPDDDPFDGRAPRG